MRQPVKPKAGCIKFSPVLTKTGDHPLAFGVIAVASVLVSVESGVILIEFDARLVSFE
jgi:hypothetical protein